MITYKFFVFYGGGAMSVQKIKLFLLRGEAIQYGRLFPSQHEAHSPRLRCGQYASSVMGSSLSEAQNPNPCGEQRL